MTFPFRRISCAHSDPTLFTLQRAIMFPVVSQWASARLEGRSLRQLRKGARFFGFTDVTGGAYCSSPDLAGAWSQTCRVALSPSRSNRCLSLPTVLKKSLNVRAEVIIYPFESTPGAAAASPPHTNPFRGGGAFSLSCAPASSLI